MLKIIVIVLFGLVLTAANGFPVEEDESLHVDEGQVYLPQSEFAKQDALALAVRQVNSTPKVSRQFRGGFGGGFGAGFGGFGDGFRVGSGGGGFRGGFGGGFRVGSGGRWSHVNGGGVRAGTAGAAFMGGRFRPTGRRVPRPRNPRRRRPKLRKPKRPDEPDTPDVEDPASPVPITTSSTPATTATTSTLATTATASALVQKRKLRQSFVEDTSGESMKIDMKELQDFADQQPQHDTVQLQIAAACANRCQPGLSRICRLLC